MKTKSGFKSTVAIAQQMEKEQKAKDNDLGGYEQTLTPLQLGKLKKTLGKFI